MEHFKFDHDAIEALVESRNGSYKGLNQAALYTSREDFQSIFSHPLVTGTFVDLGCGTGEGCLLYSWLYPERSAIGVDFEQSRIEAGLKMKEELKLEQVSLFRQDLLHSNIPRGDTYFLYFPTGMVLDRILNELYQSSHDFRIVAIESHGDLFSRLEKENWLNLVAEIPLKSERHHPMAHIYERTFKPRDPSLLPFKLSFLRAFLLIEENDYAWLGESYGMEWTFEDRFELLTPPRTIHWNQVKEVLSFDQVDVKFQRALELRQLGEVTVKTLSSEFKGHIRKVIVRPTFHLEISSGEKVEWSHIVTITQGSILCYDSSSV
ncbi:class I SAM-dependent methyltransferase [Peredibacter sp. HCB2-198]|uniref:class I SAM-dependent methyltransferase n=1 Tax=Peredibacter sp. HCB2-198 TaxID=3383025 RepID=UPI0038B47BEE